LPSEVSSEYTLKALQRADQIDCPRPERRLLVCPHHGRRRSGLWRALNACEIMKIPLAVQAVFRSWVGTLRN